MTLNLAASATAVLPSGQGRRQAGEFGPAQRLPTWLGIEREIRQDIAAARRDAIVAGCRNW